MTTPVTISLMASVAGVAVGLLALRVSRVRGWRELRWFGVVAFLSSAYAVSNVTATGTWAMPVLLGMSRVQLAVAILQHWAWMRYAEAFSRSRSTKAGRWLEGLVIAAAAASLLPGAAFDGTVTYHTFPVWHVAYNDAHMTPLGLGTMTLLPPVASVVFARFVRAHREGVRYATVQTAAYAAVVAFSVNDAMVSTGRFALPYLLDVGFVLPVGLIAWATSLRFVQAAQDLEALRGRLELLVEERTRALAEAQEALARAERLASLGRLADGVAHQVSSPAAAVTANLHYLAEHLPGGGEVREAVDESIQAMQRINDLTRRIADAGRFAHAGRFAPDARAPAAIDLGALVERVLAAARPRLPGRITADADVPAGLMVWTRSEVLERVLQTLIANAVDAVPPQRAGRIDIRAERRGAGVRMTVADDGVGMDPAVLERAFEPFFTTKPAGQGSGLGLSVSRGIIEIHGGALWLESTPERGTTAVVVLPERQSAT
jgi:signal transduction histidine kinase